MKDMMRVLGFTKMFLKKGTIKGKRINYSKLPNVLKREKAKKEAVILICVLVFLVTTRETEIIDLLLKQSWIQLGKGVGGERSHAEKGVAVRKDLNINGFNSFC